MVGTGVVGRALVVVGELADGDDARDLDAQFFNSLTKLASTYLCANGASVPTGPLWTFIGRWALSHSDHARHITTASVVVGVVVGILTVVVIPTVPAHPLFAVGSTLLDHAVHLPVHCLTHLAVLVG